MDEPMMWVVRQNKTIKGINDKIEALETRVDKLNGTLSDLITIVEKFHNAVVSEDKTPQAISPPPPPPKRILSEDVI